MILVAIISLIAVGLFGYAAILGLVVLYLMSKEGEP